MALQRLQVTDFRCLQNVSVDLDSAISRLISGANGSGKTSLLEAIYVLGRGRSFRTRAVEHLIRRGADRFVVFGEAIRGDRVVPIGVEGRSGRVGTGIRAKIDGMQARSVAELSENLPVQIIDPEVHQLIEGGSGTPSPVLGLGGVPRGTRIYRPLATLPPSVACNEMQH